MRASRQLGYEARFAKRRALSLKQAELLNHMPVEFDGRACKLLCLHYDNGRLAIRLVDWATNELVATATVNVPEVHLDNDEVLIKDWGENEGMLQALEDAGICKQTGRIARYGLVVARACKLLLDG